MDTLTRRRFLVASGVTGAVALAAGAGTVGWRELAARAGTDPLPGDASVLVLVTLYGGNDGLGTVIPYADPAYHDARGELAYDEGEVLQLGDDLGLNPAMTGCHALWEAGRLAIVRGVGYPKPDRSHFRSMDIWQTGSPDRPVPTGWVGRWLDATGPDPLRVVSVGATLPPLAVGDKAAGVALPLTGFAPPAGEIAAGVAALAEPDPADPPTQALAARSCATLLQATEALATPPGEDEEDGEAQRQGGSAGGQGGLARQLAAVTRCIRAGVPTRVYAVSLGGFDTHADEKGTQSRLLGELDAAVAGFLAGFAGDPRVVVAAYSEFGRRVAANASDGTDHGTAGPVLVAGAAVRGGFFGDQPGLTALDGGDLRVTTDFRSVYGTLLERVLETDAGRVLDGTRPALDFR